MAALLAVGMAVVLFRAGPVFAATPPANDDFDNATVITSTPFTDSVDTTAATAAADDPTFCGFASHTVWYSFTATTAETVTVASTGSSYFPNVSVYTGRRGALSQVACGFGPFPPTEWAATAGVTYHIMASAGFGLGGTLALNLTVALPPVPPPNDDFDRATVVTALPFTDTVDPSNATTAADDPTGCGRPQSSLWYTFTASTSETFAVTTNGSTYQNAVSVYTGSRGALSQIACQTTGAPAKWSGTAGVTYHIMVVNTSPFGLGSGDRLTLTVTASVPPANDDFDHATVVSALPFTDSTDTTGATAAPDDPTSCGGSDSSVWYSLTPTVNEVIVADTSSSTYAAGFSVYTGTRGSLSLLSCGAPFPATAGVTYHVMVANTSFLPAGQLVLRLQGILPPANDDISHATVVTSVPFSDNIDTTGATTAPGDPTCAFPPRATVWYRYTAPASGSIEINSFNSRDPFTVSAYSGSPGALTQLTCGVQSAVPFFVAKGATYYFMVGSEFGTGGVLQFNINAVADIPATSACTITVTGKVTGSVTVRSGTTCLSSATVTGSVTVGAGAQLLATTTTIGGSVSSDGASAVAICNSSIKGSLTVRASTGLVLIGDAGDSSLACPGNKIGGSVVLGGPSVTGNRSGVELGGNTIAGQVMVTGNSVDPTTVLATDDAAIEVEGNHIGVRLTCTDNAPVPVNDGFVNTATSKGSGQCQRL